MNVEVRMKYITAAVLTSAMVLNTACTPEPATEAPAQTAATAGNTAPEQAVEALNVTPGAASTPAAETAPAAPAVAATDPLMLLSCADFLATAKIAATQPADDAALAAQDELVNGLTWVHGYMFAKNDGKYDVLSQKWLEVTAKRVFDNCAAAKDPKTTNLFDVATS
jgi:cytoskeletal protein RodZ